MGNESPSVAAVQQGTRPDYSSTLFGLPCDPDGGPSVPTAIPGVAVKELSLSYHSRIACQTIVLIYGKLISMS